MNKDDKEIKVGKEGKWDQSKRAEAILDHILHTEVAVESDSKLEEGVISIEEALKQRPILDKDTGRNQSRVLFVSTDESLLEPNTASRNHYLKMSPLFDEIHIMVLIPRKGSSSYERLLNNIWVYKVFCGSIDDMSRVAVDSAIDALTFRNQVRPDVIVGIDPFDAGHAAYKIAATFARPVQIHINTDLLSTNFQSNPENKRKYNMGVELLRKVASVRTSTDILKEKITKRFKKIVDVSVIPHFYNFKNLAKLEPSFDLHTRYPGFSFIMLAFGPLTADSHLHELFTALRRSMVNPRFGLIVVGDGPAKQLFVEKTKLLGIEKNVVFQSNMEDKVSYLKTADLLVETDVKEGSEINILEAAAAGLPIVAKETDLRLDLFKDGTSAFLCPPDDVNCIYQKTTKLINTPALRKQFSDISQNMAKDRLQEDEAAYYLSLRHTIEKIII